MAGAVRHVASWREPDADAVAASFARASLPFAATDNREDAPDALEAIRERLYATMWDDAGIVLDAQGLARAAGKLGELAEVLDAYRLPPTARDRSFNLAWHGWLDLSNLVAVSRVIVRAAQARENSRGAHFRADFPEPGDLAGSTYTRVRADEKGDLVVEPVPVAFTRVRPGDSLV
jgi:fumarate reductase flavoprotein subunit